MKTSNNIATQNTAIVRLVVVISLFVLSTTTVKGQNVQTVNNTTETSIVKNEVTVSLNKVASTTTDFAIWFVGAQKTSTNPNNETTTNSKKALINSGVKTSNVLIRSILKKVSLQGSSVA